MDKKDFYRSYSDIETDKKRRDAESNKAFGRVSDFVMSCHIKYGDGGVFDIGARVKDIQHALHIRVTDKEGVLREFSKPLSEIPFDADSWDTEMLRDIILIERGEEPWEHILAPVAFEERDDKFNEAFESARKGVLPFKSEIQDPYLLHEAQMFSTVALGLMS